MQHGYGGPTINCRVAFPSAVNISQNTIYIPFRAVGRLIAVDARVDTTEGLFILDTGASDLLLNETYFDSERTYIRLVGVLGYRVFQDFEILIDYSIRQLIVTRVDKDGRRMDPQAIYQSPVDSLNFKLRGHVMVVKAHVNGVRLDLGLDTGAELNLLDIGVKRRVLDNFEILRRVTMTGAGEEEIELVAGILYGVDLGVGQATGMRTLLTRMWKVNQALGAGLDGVLGYEFLFDKRTLINYKKGKLYFFEPIKS